MKIYFLRLEHTAFGGSEVYLQRVCQILRQQHIDFRVMHCAAPKFLASWVKALWFNLESKIKKNNKVYFSLARVTCADIYRAGDGVHRAYMKAMGLNFWHNPLHFVYCYLEKHVFRNAKIIIANSHRVKQEIIDYYNIASSKIVVIYNGISPVQVLDETVTKLALCAQLNLPEDKPIILFVGSGFKRKGADTFLRILAQLQQRFSAIIVGKDKHEAKYKSLARDLGLTHNVRFVGQRHDIEMFYTASDILLFPSRYDPFSNVVLEAMCFKNAVFTSSCNGAHEVLDPYYVIHGEKDKEIALKIDKLLTNPKQLEQAKQHNIEKINLYSLESNVRQTLSVIQSYMFPSDYPRTKVN